MTIELSIVLTLLMASPILNAQRNPPGALNGFHNERLDLPPISQPLQIAQPNEIPVVLHASGLTKIFVVQQSLEGMGMIEASGQTIPLLHNSDGSTYISVTPIQLGKIDIAVTAFFADTAIARQTVPVEVEPSDTPPAALLMTVGGGVSPPWIRLDVGSLKISERLFPQALYLNVPPHIPIFPFTLAAYTIKTLSDTPIIRFDSASATVTALSRGDALLETSFSGQTLRTCIQVRNSTDGVDISNCRELRDSEKIAAAAPLDETWANDPAGIVTYYQNGYGYPVKRLTVFPPNHTVDLGQPLDITIQLTAEKLTSISFAQWVYDSDGIGVPSVNTGPDHQPLGSGSARIVAESGSNKTLQIIPLALGELEVCIRAHFADGGFAQQLFLLHVLPSSHNLQNIVIRPLTAILTVSGPGLHQTRLAADVTYSGIGGAIRLRDLIGTHFTVAQPANPVLSIDPHGNIQALAPGDTAILTDFAGSSGRIPIHIQ